MFDEKVMQNFTNFPNGLSVFNAYMPGHSILQAPLLRISGGSASPLVQNTNAYDVRQSSNIGTVAANTNMPSLATAINMKGATVGNLATGMTRVYTFLASVNSTSGAVTFFVTAGTDFASTRPVNMITDFYLGDNTRALVGYLTVKNASGSNFVPGTTNLDATGITSHFNDQFGFSVQAGFSTAHYD